jgi:molybdopterin-binding protein
LIGSGSYMNLLAERSCRTVLDEQGLVNVLPMRVATTCHGRGMALLKPLAVNGPGRPVVFRTPLTEGFGPGAEVLVRLEPDDIVLSAGPIENASVQNQLRGRCVEVFEDDDRVLCRIDVGVDLLAAVTADSARSLALAPGRVLWCLFKARSTISTAVGRVEAASERARSHCRRRAGKGRLTAPRQGV